MPRCWHIYRVANATFQIYDEQSIIHHTESFSPENLPYDNGAAVNSLGRHQFANTRHDGPCFIDTDTDTHEHIRI